MAQTIVTYRASGFPAKFGTRTSASFELFDGIKAASSFLGARFALLVGFRRIQLCFYFLILVKHCSSSAQESMT